MCTTITRFLLLKSVRRSLIIRTYVESTSPQIRPRFDAIKIKSPSRPKLTKIKKPPFAKSLFVGEIDPDVLTYPEVLDEDTLKALNERLLTLEDFFAKQETLKRKSLLWLGHVMKMEEDKMSKKALHNKEKGRPIGRPQTRWMDQTQKDIKDKGAD
uniref:Uncharacterized protein n=1 Tax=Timema cristinae TaxID=61476 RepID=A0A7R9CDY4_TIMCR|nr:unnamed protein product [Timema cristinae]